MPLIEGLPTEVLEQIIQQSLPQFDEVHLSPGGKPIPVYYVRLVELMQVSTKWCTVIAGTSAFWIFLSPILHPQLLSQALRLSSQRPLESHRLMHDWVASDDQNLRFVALIPSFSFRLKILDIRFPNHAGDSEPYVLLLNEPAPLLEEMHITMEDPSALLPLCLDQRYPRLKVLTLQNAPIPWNMFSAPALESFSLVIYNDGVSPSFRELTSALHRNPTLRRVSLDLNRELPHEDASLSPPVELPHLDELDLTGCDANNIAALVGCLPVTQAQVLILKFEPDDETISARDIAILEVAFEQILGKRCQDAASTSKPTVDIDGEMTGFTVSRTAGGRTQLQGPTASIFHALRLHAANVPLYIRTDTPCWLTEEWRVMLSGLQVTWIRGRLLDDDEDNLEDLARYLGDTYEDDDNVTRAYCPDLEVLNIDAYRPELSAFVDMVRSRCSLGNAIKRLHLKLDVEEADQDAIEEISVLMGEDNFKVVVHQKDPHRGYDAFQDSDEDD